MLAGSIIPQIMHIRHSGVLGRAGFARNVAMGCALAYAIEEEQYAHIPLIAVFPSVYCGYNLYRRREAVIAALGGAARQLKSAVMV